MEKRLIDNQYCNFHKYFQIEHDFCFQLVVKVADIENNLQVVAIPAPVLQSLAFVQTLVSLTCAASFYCHWDVVKCWK